MSNPFSTPSAKAGHGTIHLALLSPNTPRLKTASYQYPLKLVSPAPLFVESSGQLIHTVYLLTYGGGLVAGDAIDLCVTLEASTRLVLLTQGSTKLFKAPSSNVLSKQRTTFTVAPGSALCYLPDPVQPFERSCFEQNQAYNITIPDGAEERPSGSLCVLDWVCNGRPATGEDWSFYRYGSRNEVYLAPSGGKRRLLLRDNISLDADDTDGPVAVRMQNLAVFGTLILYGPLMQSLGAFFIDDFKATPRIGGRKWDSGSENEHDEDVDEKAMQRVFRQREQSLSGVLWSAATVRGCTVVKFGAPEVEAGRRWLRSMLSAEGTIAREFGDRALLCLR